MQISKRVMAAISAASLSIASAMIVDLEGVEYTPYYDVAGVLTVCYGHTGSDIVKDKVYSPDECQVLLDTDLARIASEINPQIKTVLPVTMHAALYSFAYNVGSGAFNSSTLLKKLNANDYAGACSQLKRWVYAAGKPWKGLMNRRDIEEAVCRYAQ